MIEITDNLEEVFDLSVNKTIGSRKRKLAGMKSMSLSLKRMHSRPLWRRQLASIKSKGTIERKKG